MAEKIKNQWKILFRELGKQIPDSEAGRYAYILACIDKLTGEELNAVFDSLRDNAELKTLAAIKTWRPTNASYNDYDHYTSDLFGVIERALSEAVSEKSAQYWGNRVARAVRRQFERRLA